MAKKKELKKLRRGDLLELLLAQAKEVEVLKAEIEGLRQSGEGSVCLDAPVEDALDSDSAGFEAAGEACDAEYAEDSLIHEADPGRSQVGEIEQVSSEVLRTSARRRAIDVPSPLQPESESYVAFYGEAITRHVMVGASEASSTIVDDARLKASGIIAAAQQDASMMLASARAEAKQIVDAAREDAMFMRLGATREADVARSRAQAVCDDLLENTRKTCASLFAEAEQEIDRLFAEADERAQGPLTDWSRFEGRKKDRFF